MSYSGHALVEAMHREAIEKHLQQGLPSSVKAPSIHYTELPEAKQGEPLAEEWNTYRREVGRLLAENQEGRFTLIKGQAIVGVYDNWAAAREAGLQRFFAGSIPRAAHSH